MYLKTWSLIGGVVWGIIELLGCGALPEEATGAVFEWSLFPVTLEM